MRYAEVSDVQARMIRTLTDEEEALVETKLDDAGAMIDAMAPNGTADIKKIVSCQMVIRVLGAGDLDGVPIGATQGSMSGLGYSQSWTMSGSAVNGELYLSKAERRMLGLGNVIGSYSPVEGLVSNE